MQNASTNKKSVNRALKSNNGKGNKSRLSSSNGSRTKKAIVSQSIGVNMSPIIRQSNPRMSSEPGKFCVAHRELIGPLIAPSEVYQLIKRLRCNPGSESTFAWLSKMAPLFESFRFRKLRFLYITRASTIAIGNIIISPDYDSSDGIESTVNEQFMFNNDGTMEVPIWTPQVSLVLQPGKLNRLYKAHSCMSDLRFASTKQDPKTIDPAQVFICSEVGPSSVGQLGKLIVEYEVEFLIPQSPTDPVSQGGAQLAWDTLQNGATVLPIVGPASAYVQENVPILEMKSLSAGPFPTSVVGTFARDYEGVLDLILNGTGISGVADVFVSSQPGASGLADDILQVLNPSYLIGSVTVQSAAYQILAKAGQYLKIRTPSNTVLSTLRVLMGGTGFTMNTGF